MRARVLFLAALGACGPVDDPPRSPAPFNSCAANPCSTYKQLSVSCTTGDLCEARDPIDPGFVPIFVVSVPESSTVAPGQTFASTYTSLKQIKNELKGRCSGQALCLPAYGESAGTYQVEPQVADAVPFYLGTLNGRKDVNFSIPAHVTLRPLWSFEAPSVTPTDAPLAGLPLFPIFARVTFGEQPTAPGAGDPPTPNIGYDAALAGGQYERSMMPDPPFDEAFPPVISRPNESLQPVFPRVFDNVLLGDPNGYPVKSHEVTVTREGGNLEGWSLYLRDIVTERRISTRRTLMDIGGLTKIDTVNQGGSQNADIRDGVELVLAPPARVANVPELRISLVSNTVLKVARYPSLPPPATVHGFVADANDKAVVSQIVFESTEVTPFREVSNPDLHFATRADTDSQGRYVVVLPPGKYKVIITPQEGSGFAKTITDLYVGDRQVDQQGIRLEVLSPALLKGVCRLPDDRLLADAEVEARASSSLLLATPLTERDRARWPRTVTTRTNTAGEFVLPVDPGTYDVVVRPAAGTRFPWLVHSQVIVAPHVGTQPNPAELDLRVPVPRYLPVTLHHASDNPIIHALVRVFVGHQVLVGAKVVGTVGIEIGRARTGTSGEFELYLDPQAK